MKRMRFVVLLGLLVFILLTGLTVLAQRVNAPEKRREFTAEQKEIIAAIQTFSDVNAQASATGDLDLLTTILIDHPVFRRTLDRATYAALKDYIARVSGRDIATSDFGYLTAMKNKIFHRRHGEALLRKALADAEAENRKFSDADMATLRELNYGSLVGMSLVSLGPETTPGSNARGPYYRESQFSSIEIRGDRADAYYERVKGWHAILIRIDGKWYIAQVL